MNYIGLETKKLTKVTNKLNILLSTYSVYYQNLRSFHWHVKGNSFFEMHNLFEDLYNDAKIKIDEIAERILTIDQKPLGSMAEYLKHSKIKEAADIMSDKKMTTILLDNHKSMLNIMRDTISTASQAGDEGTVDVISGFISSLEKKSWMLNAWRGRRKAGFLN